MNYKIYINIYKFFFILRKLYRNQPFYALIWVCKNAFHAHCVKKIFKQCYTKDEYHLIKKGSH